MNERDGGPGVLAGYDGSPGAEKALCWAVEEAQLRDVPLTVCHAWQWPYPFRPPSLDVLGQVESVGVAVVESGAHQVREMAAGLDVRSLLVKGAPSAVLLDAGRTADLIVLGSRGHGGFEDLRIGSTAVQVPAHSVAPVAVVRPALPPIRRNGVRIVAGVDGSPASRAALGFAFESAELRGGSVTAVCAWWDLGTLPGPDRLPFTDSGAVRRDAEARFAEAIAPWAARYPKVPVTTEFVTERPQRALTSLAKGALLLVLGDRGVGSVPGIRLGPVTQAALSSAPCPIVITPAPPG